MSCISPSRNDKGGWARERPEPSLVRCCSSAFSHWRRENAVCSCSWSRMTVMPLLLCCDLVVSWALLRVIPLFIGAQSLDGRSFARVQYAWNMHRMRSKYKSATFMTANKNKAKEMNEFWTTLCPVSATIPKNFFVFSEKCFVHLFFLSFLFRQSFAVGAQTIKLQNLRIPFIIFELTKTRNCFASFACQTTERAKATESDLIEKVAREIHPIWILLFGRWQMKLLSSERPTMRTILIAIECDWLGLGGRIRSLQRVSDLFNANNFLHRNRLIYGKSVWRGSRSRGRRWCDPEKPTAKNSKRIYY